MKTLNTLFVVLLLIFSLESHAQYDWSNMVRINYSKANAGYIDDIVIRFGNYDGITTTENAYWDVRSLNSQNFIASLKGTASLAIQTRPLNFNSDTVGLRIVSATTGNFQLFFNEFENFKYAKDILIWDLYTNTQQSILQDPNYEFAITIDPASQGYNRFKMIFIAEQLFVTASNVVVNNLPGIAGANVNYSGSAYSKCSPNVHLSYSIPSGSYFPIGTTNVQLTVTDDCGNTMTSDFSVIVNDADAPVFGNVTDVTIQNDPGQCTGSFIPAIPTASDNSGGLIITGIRNDNASLNAPYPKGITLITWKAVDASGNTSTTTQKITVVDAEAPLINPVNMQVDYEPNFENCAYKVQDNAFDPGYIDVCSPVTITNNITNTNSLVGAVFPLGKSTIIWTATDEVGNSSTWSQDINIVSRLSAMIPDVKAIASGADENTIYIGYNPASSLTYNSNTAATYKWSVSSNLSIAGADNLATVKITAPNVSTNPYMLNLIVTNQFGCSASVAKSIKVVDIRCGTKNDKVQVCSPQRVQQCAAVNTSLATNLTKGYKLGYCNSTAKRQSVSEEIKTVIAAYPNPTTGFFVLTLNDIKTGVAELQVIDMMGRVVVNKKLNITQRKEQLSIDLSNRSAGVYTIRVSTQDGMQLTKVVMAQ